MIEGNHVFKAYISNLCGQVVLFCFIMEVRRPSEKSDVVQVTCAYRRGSEKYDYLASRGSISQGVINFKR